MTSLNSWTQTWARNDWHFINSKSNFKYCNLDEFQVWVRKSIELELFFVFELDFGAWNNRVTRSLSLKLCVFRVHISVGSYVMMLCIDISLSYVYVPLKVLDEFAENEWIYAKCSCQKTSCQKLQPYGFQKKSNASFQIN